MKRILRMMNLIWQIPLVIVVMTIGAFTVMPWLVTYKAWTGES